MSNLNKWVDVREKQIREATDTNITIKKLDNLNCYFTVKEINEIDENNEIVVNHPSCRKIDKNFKMLEYTPIDEDYNVRVYVNDKNEIFEYYLDVTDGMEVREGVPYYNDLFLDVIYYNKNKKMTNFKMEDSNVNLYMLDENELEDALNENIITKDQYNKAYRVANKLMYEIENGTNIFINRGLTDYLDIIKNEK